MLNFPKIFKIFLNSIKFYFWKILENVLNFCANYFITFSKVIDEYIFAEYSSPRTEILATPLQYRTWKEFMYEILSRFLFPRTRILEPLLGQSDIAILVVVSSSTLNSTFKFPVLIGELRTQLNSTDHLQLLNYMLTLVRPYNFKGDQPLLLGSSSSSIFNPAAGPILIPLRYWRVLFNRIKLYLLNRRKVSRIFFW